MRNQPDRRRFLQVTSAIGLGAGLGPFPALASVTPEAGTARTVEPEFARFRPEIEPVVRWIEQTPRDRAFEVALTELQNGLAYRDLMAGLFLAGIRNIKPRPVGFKFHAVMVINSAHLLGQTADPRDALLPMLWALDNFKGSQDQDVKEGDWTLSRIDDAKVPSPAQARARFREAMDAWDAEAADVAVAGLCRSSGAAEVMEYFWRYCIRDHRNIGHKAIFGMQCWRTLQAIGWQHAEPVLRSLAYGILDLQGDKNAQPVGPYRVNLDNARKIRDNWQAGKADASATRKLVDAFRTESPEGASASVVEILNAGVSADSAWDAVALGAGELMMRKPGIQALHAVTSCNALHYVYTASGDAGTRKLALLQAAGWLPMFRQRVQPPNGPNLDSLEPLSTDSQGAEAVVELFHDLDKDRIRAGRKAIGYLSAGGSADAIYRLGRSSIFRKGRDAHDYKYGAASWEEHDLAADPSLKPALLVASMVNMPGAGKDESSLMKRARDASDRVFGRRT